VSSVARYAESVIPTDYGAIDVVVYRAGDEEHLALCNRERQTDEPWLVRVHSECWTGEVAGSLKCDCREQLDTALDAIARAGRGVLVYLRQEGRGIGLGNKIRAYALQNAGADTVEANERLGFAADLRSYGLAAAMLADLGVSSVALMTNNPDKVAGLEAAGVRVARRVPHWVEHDEHAREYLEVKRAKLGHRE
jgi:GTP cyclohydrolase II